MLSVQLLCMYNAILLRTFCSRTPLYIMNSSTIFDPYVIFLVSRITAKSIFICARCLTNSIIFRFVPNLLRSRLKMLLFYQSFLIFTIGRLKLFTRAGYWPLA